MLDQASIERLAEFPERNDPLLNVALAEEGGGHVLLGLAGCDALGGDAIEVIAARVVVDRDLLSTTDESGTILVAQELEQKVVGHRNAPRSVRDAVLGRHSRDPFFVLSAATHADATPLALETAACWPSASPLHDRPWLALLDGAARDADLLWSWATKGEMLREAAATLASDSAMLEQLAHDPARRVRRAVMSNPRASAVGPTVGSSDAAAEVRARAARGASGNGASISPVRSDRDLSARFASALRAMGDGGVLETDVRRALTDAGPALDEEGAFLAARHLSKDELCTLVAHAIGDDPFGSHASGVALGLGLRGSGPSETNDADDACLPNDVVHLVTKRPSQETRLTGKARVAFWISEGMGRSRAIEDSELARLLAPGTLASDRMVLRRWAARKRASLASVCSLDVRAVPTAVIELCWRDNTVSDDDAVALSAKVAQTTRSDRELPEDELDLSPSARPLAVLERAVLAAVAHAPVSPRAALAVVALEPRRCRYVLSAMPTWKGSLTGARLARVLRSHAGALSAARPQAGAPSGSHPPAIARWTERRLIEAEAAIAIAIGDLTGQELLRRLRSGAIKLDTGVTLAAGVEARVAIDGAEPFIPLLDYATSRRTEDASALALWVLLEELDRVRAPSLVASAVDGLSVAGSVVPPAVCEALATLERRAPGRLENVHAQSPRGRATVASAIARAYRAFGGMRDE